MASGKLPPLVQGGGDSACERSPSAEKRERIKAALAGPPDSEGDDESEFEVRNSVHEHYIEYSQRHEMRLDLGTEGGTEIFKVNGSKLAPRDQMLLLSNRKRLHEAVKGAPRPCIVPTACAPACAELNSAPSGRTRGPCTDRLLAFSHSPTSSGNYGIKQPIPFDMYLQRAGMKSAIYDSMPCQGYEFKIRFFQLAQCLVQRPEP